MTPINRRTFLSAAAYTALATKGLTKELRPEVVHPDANAPFRSLEEFRRTGMSDTDLLLEAASSGEKNLFIPSRLYRLESTIELLSGVTLSGNGHTSCLRLELSSGDHAIPLVVAKQGESQISLFSFLIDGNGANLSNPRGDQFAVVSGSAVIVSASDSVVQNLIVKDAWDNGIVVIHSKNGRGPAGQPNDVRLLFNRTENCGVGFHDPGGPGQIGSGANNGSGARCIIIGHHDRGSRGAVTVDDGGGASGYALGCISIENAGDARVGAGNPTRASQGTGTAFYSGNPDWSFETCKAYFPRKHGFWLAAAGGMQARDCEVIGAQEHGFYLSGPNHNLSDCRAKNVSQKQDNTYSSYFVEAPFGNAEGIILDNCVSEFDAAAERKPKFGYEERRFNSFHPSTTIKGGKFSGKTAGISPLQGLTSLNMVIANDTMVFDVPETMSKTRGSLFKDNNGFLRVR